MQMVELYLTIRLPAKFNQQDNNGCKEKSKEYQNEYAKDNELFRVE
jgi:hypothetical protein